MEDVKESETERERKRETDRHVDRQTDREVTPCRGGRHGRERMRETETDKWTRVHILTAEPPPPAPRPGDPLLTFGDVDFRGLNFGDVGFRRC